MAAAALGALARCLSLPVPLADKFVPCISSPWSPIGRQHERRTCEPASAQLHNMMKAPQINCTSLSVPVMSRLQPNAAPFMSNVPSEDQVAEMKGLITCISRCRPSLCSTLLGDDRHAGSKSKQSKRVLQAADLHSQASRSALLYQGNLLKETWVINALRHVLSTSASCL